MNKEQSDDDVSAADSKQLGGKTKDAAERWDATEGSGWLPGWNLSSLTELTGAFTNTVKNSAEIVISCPSLNPVNRQALNSVFLSYLERKFDASCTVGISGKNGCHLSLQKML